MISARPTQVFADTSFWIALAVKQDAHHTQAREWARTFEGSILTTQPVLYEVGNSLARPTWRTAGAQIIQRLLSHPQIVFEPITDSILHEGVSLFCSRSDKSWSLTDCVSFIIMKQRHITHALTADTHFVQAGFQILLSKK